MNNTFQNTNYYNDIIKAYTAGITNDTNTRDTLIRNLNTSLKDSCKTYTSNPNVISQINPITGNEMIVDLDSYSGKYRNDIEFQNSLREQLIADEETYFVNKYDANLYQYLITKRNAYFSNLDSTLSKTSTVTSNCKNTVSSGVSVVRNPSTPNTITNNRNKAVIGYYNNDGNFVESPNKCNDPSAGIDFYKMFSKYLPYADPDLINRKIEYRETEHDFLMKINSLMTGIYYVLFIVMIILLIGGNNLNLTQRAPIYIGLLLLPLLYPYIFKLLTFIYNYLTNNKNIHGPKNAFIDSNGEDEMLDSYNT
jgi:hypothetical protein